MADIFSMSNAKINRKRLQIAQISLPIRKSGSKKIKCLCQNFNGSSQVAVSGHEL